VFSAFFVLWSSFTHKAAVAGGLPTPRLPRELVGHPPQPVESCTLRAVVIGSAYRPEFGLLRNRPDASLLLRARWIARRGCASAQ
jgi:hypothetical protein